MERDESPRALQITRCGRGLWPEACPIAGLPSVNPASGDPVYPGYRLGVLPFTG